MKKYEYGDKNSRNVLIQMIGDHDLSGMPDEVARIRELAGDDFFLVALKVNSWNRDLSPWRAPAVFGDEDFGEGAKDSLAEILKITVEPGKRYFIGGYSLAGLFALWAVYQTEVFEGAAAASPSIWFPRFIEYMKGNDIQTDKVYLSLGDREEKTKNPLLSQVGTCIREGYRYLEENGTECILEWNKGNHFKNPALRIGKAFAWLLSGER